MTRRSAGFAVLGAVALLATACASSSSTVAGSGSSGSPSAPGSATASGSPAAPSSAAAPPTSPAASAHVAGVPPCPTSQLTVSLGASQGTAGSVIETIDFTNNGSSNCTLYGYPGVSLQGGSPVAQIGAAAARTTTAPASLVTLTPGSVANAQLQVTVAGNYPSSTCDPAPASSLLVYPPGQTVAASVAYTTTGCSATSVALLHVSAVQAGAGSAG
jgi:Protein of unknown function (DUF4232)